MPISFQCPHCGRPTRVADDLAGRRIRCPGCKEPVSVPCEEIIDVEDLQIAAPQTARRTRRPFEEEAERKAAPRPTKSITLDNNSQASNPGGVRVNILKYWSSFPRWPTIWIVATSLFALGALFHKGMLVGAIISGILMWLYWTRVREHFLHGCALPGVIVSVENQLVAFCTDLTTGDGNYPAVRILRQPIHSMCDGPPKKNQRVVGVAVYEPAPDQNDHWATFHPKIASCVTTDQHAVRATFDSIEENDWQELIDFLQEIPRKTEGLHRCW